MIYRAIGVMSGSSLDGLDIAFAEFQENAGKWNYQIREADCIGYETEWVNKLKTATTLSAKEYQLLHVDYGHYIGKKIAQFIRDHNLDYQVALVSSHGHTTFHDPSRKLTSQLGEGAAIAAETKLPVVTDLRSMDLALGGEGAPIVPIGEKYLLGDYSYFLNLGGIANISVNGNPYVAFDICAANRVLNMLVNERGKEFDDRGEIASSGKLNEALLEKLNALDYYRQPFPKSLANEFGTDEVYPLLKQSGVSTEDALRTYVEHIAIQTSRSIEQTTKANIEMISTSSRLLATGGGAMNDFMVERIRHQLSIINVELIVAEENLVRYKEAMIMAFIGVLRWRQEVNVLSSVTGAERDSVGGALWSGE